MQTLRVFISHNWATTGHDDAAELLNKVLVAGWEDLSITKETALSLSREHQQAAIDTIAFLKAKVNRLQGESERKQRDSAEPSRIAQEVSNIRRRIERLDDLIIQLKSATSNIGDILNLRRILPDGGGKFASLEWLRNAEPLTTNLALAIHERLGQSDVVVLALADGFVYRHWLEFEFRAAADWLRPVIALETAPMPKDFAYYAIRAQPNEFSLRTALDRVLNTQPDSSVMTQAAIGRDDTRDLISSLSSSQERMQWSVERHGDFAYMTRLRDAMAACDRGDWDHAESVLGAIRAEYGESADLVVTRQLAVATYRARGRTRSDLVSLARFILEELSPHSSNDVETLALWAEIQQRLHRMDSDSVGQWSEALDEALRTYERLFRLSGAYHSGAQCAALLVRRAAVLGDESGADWLRAQSVWAQVLSIANEILASGAPQGEEIWVRSTIIEALYGLGREDEGDAAYEAAKRMNPPPDPWMIEVLDSGLAKLKAFLKR